MRKTVWRVTLILLILALSALPTRGIAPDHEEQAAARMRALGLVRGYPDGGLHLDLTLTRAEMVTLIVRGFGLEETAKLLKGTPSYPDATNHTWASGYIAVARKMIEEKGQSMGLPDGTFGPDTNLTVAQSVAFLLKFLGIQPDASLSWPNNYIQAAVDAGTITEEDGSYLEGLTGEDADRGLAFYLIDKAFATYRLPENGMTVYQTFHDREAPILRIDVVPPSTAAEKVTLTGRVEGATGLYLAHGATRPVTFGADGSFAVDVDLTLGENQLRLFAVDLVGNEASQTLRITREVRRTPPSSALDRLLIGPRTATLLPGWIVQVEVMGLDSGGHLVTVDPVVTVDPPGLGWFDEKTGHFGAQKPGRVTITATVGAKTVSTTMEITTQLPEGANRPPVIRPLSAQTYQTGQQVALGVTVVDPEGKAVTCSATGLPPGLTIDPQRCVISGAPTRAGSYSGMIYAVDSGNLVAVQPLTILVK